MGATEKPVPVPAVEPPSPPTVEVASSLDAPVDSVREHARTMAGVNFELGPWVSMSYPAAFERIDPAQAQQGQVLFRSWLRVLRVVPFDRHSLCIESFHDDEGRSGFVEESTSWMQRRWRHEREIVAAAHGCLLIDRVTAAPRLAPARPLVERIVPAIFRHRHRRLRWRFGGQDVTGTGAAGTQTTQGDT